MALESLGVRSAVEMWAVKRVGSRLARSEESERPWSEGVERGKKRKSGESENLEQSSL